MSQETDQSVADESQAPPREARNSIDRGNTTTDASDDQEAKTKEVMSIFILNFKYIQIFNVK